MKLFSSAIGFLALSASVFAALEPHQNPALPYHGWAEKPPMGWNSWDPFATTVTEDQTRAEADVMASKLKHLGWEYIVVDIQWYESQATGFDYRKDARLEMDEWGRLIPAVNRFPSSADGKGFKDLANHVQGLGLKFGLHLMRGIPRQAVEMKTPIKGTSYTAADIADTTSTCSWNSDMYGIDMTKPGAQEYYDSVFELMASWDLDFIKVDDLSRPYHKAEIEAIRKAIDRTGRSIVFSTSPGATPVEEGPHVENHANMWRISGDFWDSWPELAAQFSRLRDWTPFRGPGHFPDGDMLPIGTIAMGKRTTNFTPDEQRTLLSLWCIARSPLILGADLTKLDEFTLSLITNAEVLAVDQSSANNREFFHREGFYGWVADIPNSKEKYLALFNARALPGHIDFDHAVYQTPPVTMSTPGHGVPIDVPIKGARKLFLVVDDGREGSRGDDVVWCEPTITAAGRLVKLTEMAWVNASSEHGEVSKEHSASGRDLLVEGKPIVSGISVHAKSVIEFDLPPATTRFQAFAAIVDRPQGTGRGPTARFLIFTQSPLATEASATIHVKLSELGLNGSVRIRDLWLSKDLGAFRREFLPTIPAHGAGLYRISGSK